MLHFSLLLIIYMPLHVFVSTYVSTFTGGLDVWKAAKDVVFFAGLPLLLYASWRRALFANKTFRMLAVLGGAYALLHGLFLLFDSDDHVLSTITASVFNTRLLGYLLLGYLVGTMRSGRLYLRYLLTATVIIASLVALFGVLQYMVLPHDFLVDFGYEVERGVRPLFFIDDKPDLPRVMSTLKDPNSFGAYLIMPILFTALALFKQKANSQLFARPFRRSILALMLSVQSIALILTFSRGALLALFVSLFVFSILSYGQQLLTMLKKLWIPAAIFIALCSLLFAQFSDTYVFENLVFHADESTVVADPNEKRLEFAADAVGDIVDQPLGHGPGTAGLVAISNPNGGVLTENYYLQIAYEVGWLGLIMFVAILFIVAQQLYFSALRSQLSTLLLASLAGYLFYSLLIHLWSNEAIALQWWLLSGTALGLAAGEKRSKSA